MKIGALDYDETTKKVTANGLLFGHVSHHTGNPVDRNGYYFIPAVAGRKGSRKPYKTIKECIPSWVTRNAIAGSKKSNWSLSDSGKDKDKASEEIGFAEPAEETISQFEDRIESLTQRLSADPCLASEETGLAEPAEETMSQFEDRKFIESLIQRLSADPCLAQPVLKAVSECNDEFIRRTQSYRSGEASQVILDLIGVVMDPKGFAKLTPDMQRNLMHRVIEYHFPNGDTTGYASCERDFFKKFGGKRHRNSGKEKK